MLTSLCNVKGLAPYAAPSSGPHSPYDGQVHVRRFQTAAASFSKSARPLAIGALVAVSARSHFTARRRSGGRAASMVALAAGAAAGEGEASELQREAARLRGEAAALERAAAAERRAARAGRLLGGGPRVGAAELQKGLREVLELEISVEQAEVFIGSLKDGNFEASLSFDDLVGADFEAGLDKFAAQQAEAARKKKEEARKESIKAVEQQQVQGAASDFMSAGGEDNLGVRVLASLVYLFPLADGFQYGLILGLLFPPLQPFFGLLYSINSLIYAIPLGFGGFIILILLSSLSKNPDLPRLLRYNMQQACVIDILIILPALIRSFTGFALPESVTFAFFVIFFGAAIYSVVLTLLGKEPDSLGLISDATKRNLGSL